MLSTYSRPYQIYDEPDIEFSPGQHVDFISLQPGESWTRTDRLELPSDTKVREVFKYEFTDRVIDWWNWGMKGDHLQTTVKLPCRVSGEVVDPRDNEGQPAIVVPASNVVEFTIVSKLVSHPSTILSIFSFGPQLRCLRQNGDLMGISLAYLLCNVINATEQFTISMSYLFIAGDSDFFIYNPPNAGDWFFLGIFYSPAYPRRKTFIIGIYIAFLSISLLAAVLYILTNPCGASRGSQCWLDAIFLGSHLIFVNPVVTLLAIAALPAQLLELKQHGHAALSLTGLASQAVIFAVLGLSWIFRVRLDHNLSDLFWTWGSFTSWYQLVGWAAVDNLVFAVVQGILFLVVLRGKRTALAKGENEPLLRS
ncbi:hypothetical protein BDV23DRAFT_190295 [Aspergillus alliaceus]|uniref:Uncharacterized protein n=1 Tax=Petromyces alliaceus TaxID=209559 RepID=A0A5N7BWZ7_PETAA|nr:hypothetical protein BDV23DRAFT_190295 [Aspergillus alliaceus]